MPVLWLIGFRGENFKRFFAMIIFLWKNHPQPPHCDPLYPKESWFVQTWMYTTVDASTQVTAFVAYLVFEKKIFLYSTQPPTPIVALPYPMDHDLHNLNLYYLRILPYKLRLYWPIGFWEEDLKRFFSIYFYNSKCLPLSPIVAHSTSKNHNFKKKLN